MATNSLHNTTWKRLKWKFAYWLDRLRPTWCWTHLAQWSWSDIKWSDIDRDCRDADVSGQPRCWCGKRCAISEPTSATTEPETVG